MTRSYALVNRTVWRSYFALVVFCGVALVVSVPGARAVRDLTPSAFLTGAPTFFYAYVLLLGLLGLGVGTASAEQDEWGRRAVISLALRVLLGQLACAPYLLFARALAPGRDGALAAIVILTTLVSLSHALLSRAIERWPGSSAGFVAKSAFFLSYYIVPLATLPALSPLGAVRILLAGAATAEAVLAFAIPVGLLLALLPLVLALRGGERA